MSLQCTDCTTKQESTPSSPVVRVRHAASFMRDRCSGGSTVQGWMGRARIARLSSLCLVGLLLVTLVVPRFGLVWHDHEDPDEDHPDDQLLRLLASSQASHPRHHPHQHSETSHVSLSAAETANLHGHYVDASLLVFVCLCHPLTLTLLRVSLRPHRRRV